MEIYPDVTKVDEGKLPAVGEIDHSYFVLGRQSAPDAPVSCTSRDGSVMGSEQTVSSCASPTSLVGVEFHEDARPLVKECSYEHGREKDVFVVDPNTCHNETEEERIEREWWESLY
jgi:hypothetical protein